ncbi:hypothetical protein HDU96_007924 [Phlyctochytrium bullatum]|nr:hypothetical protein HDU96_007924 [Phlyctochytrium bullatum]
MPQAKKPPAGAAAKNHHRPPSARSAQRPSPSTSSASASPSLLPDGARPVETNTPESDAFRQSQLAALRSLWVDGNPLLDDRIRNARRSQDAVGDAPPVEVRRRRAPRSMEQAILDAVREGCDAHVRELIPSSWEGLHPFLRRIKEKFVGRDYEGIFGKDLEDLSIDDKEDASSKQDGETSKEDQEKLMPAQLAAYAAGYTSSRSLCFWDLFTGLPEIRRLLTKAFTPSPSDAAGTKPDPIHIMALGGGPGAEVVSFAAAAFSLAPASDPTSPPSRGLHIHTHDLADYASLLHSLHTTSVAHFNLLGPSEPLLTHAFTRGDLLTTDPARRAALAQNLARASLVTCMYLLNELLAASKAKFVALVGLLVEHLAPGALVLVVDSAGSFSEVNVGGGAKTSTAPAGAGRTYMVYHLLDRVAALEPVVASDSRWYRVPGAGGGSGEELEYPAKLNSMRHFVRLYRKR